MADEQGNNQGALSQISQPSTDLIGPLQKLAENPIDQDRKWLGFASGFMQPTHGGGAGESFGNALGGMNDVLGKQEALKAAYIPHVTQALLAAQQFQRQLAIDKMFTEALTGGGQQGVSSPAMPGQLGSGTMGIVAPPSGMPTIPTAQPVQNKGGLENLSPNQIGLMKYFGKDLLPEYKLAKFGEKMDAGAMYQMPNGQRTIVPDVKSGIGGYDFNTNSIVPISNFGDFTQQNAASQAAGTASGTAPFKFQTITPAGGRSTLMSDAQIAAQVNGSPPSRSSAAGKSSQQDFPSIPANVQRQRDADALSIAKQDIDNAATPQDKAFAQKVYDKMSANYNAGKSILDSPVSSGGQSNGAQQPSPNGGIALQTPAEAAADAKLGTGEAENFIKYKDTLNNRVQEGFNLVRRNQELADQLDKYQTGRMGSEGLLKFASTIKNTFPGNDTANSLAEKIAGGNVAAGQELQQLFAGAALSNLKQVLDGQGRINAPEFRAFQAHSENLLTDPQALKKIIAFQNKIYGQDYSEQQALSQSQKAGNFNPTTWQADWAARQKSQFTNLGNNDSSAASGTPKNIQALLDKYSGK